MGLDGTARRRWFGALALAAALALLIAGGTVLKERLDNIASLFYWLACLGLTMVAMMAALRDARATQERNRREQRELLEKTLESIQAEARQRSRPK